MLSHLAAHERTARQLAAVGHALHDLCHVVGLDVTDGNVVEEEQRLSTRSEDVVHAHGDQVLAHGLMPVENLGEHELGAHAIGARDEHGIVHVLERSSGEQAAKATDAADDLRAIGGGDHLLDRIDRAAAFGGIHTRVFVRYVLRGLAHRRSFRERVLPAHDDSRV